MCTASAPTLAFAAEPADIVFWFPAENLSDAWFECFDQPLRADPRQKAWTWGKPKPRKRGENGPKAPIAVVR